MQRSPLPLPADVADDTPVRLERNDDVLYAELDSPPVNAITDRMRALLLSAVEMAEADDSLCGLVICAQGRVFSAGGDLRSVDQPADPGGVSLSDLCTRIEHLKKPVAIAIHARCIGGGGLLALACHARTGSEQASVALPELNMGLVPGAGGTQRLPRLVGINAALACVALSQLLSIDGPLGFFDATCSADEDVRALAARVVREIAVGTRPFRRTCQRTVEPIDTVAVRDWVARAHAAFPGRAAADHAVSLIVASAGTDFEAGCAQEATVFSGLAHGPDFQALRHLFYAERALPDTIEGEGGPGTIDALETLGGRLVELVCRGAVAAEVQTEAQEALRRQRRLPVLVRRESVATRLMTAVEAVGDKPLSHLPGLAPLGWTHSAISTGPTIDRDLSDRLAAAMAAAGQRCLEDGLVDSPDTVDVIAVSACGFPAHLGGPLYHHRTRIGRTNAR